MLVVTGYESLVVRNLIFGAFFGGLWASCNRLIAIWLPPRERAKFAAVWMSSTLLSFVISNPLGLLMAEHFNWRSAFLIVTVLSVPSLALLAWIRDRPEQMVSVDPRSSTTSTAIGMSAGSCKPIGSTGVTPAGAAPVECAVDDRCDGTGDYPNVAHRDVGHVRAHRGLQAGSAKASVVTKCS